MKAAKISLLLIIGVVVFTSIVWFFQRGTTSQETIKVYKTTLVSKPSEIQLPQTHTPGETHSHAEDTPHTHAHERPSDPMVQLIRERFAENPHPKTKRWLAYVESEEGRAFFDSFPTSDEWFEKSKSFGFFEETPALQAWRDRQYRKYFPTGTVDENESIIRDMMRDAILEHEHHKEEEYSRRRNSSVLIELLMDDKYDAWVGKKFGSQPPSSREWINSTFEEVRLAEREKGIDNSFTNYELVHTPRFCRRTFGTCQYALHRRTRQIRPRVSSANQRDTSSTFRFALAEHPRKLTISDHSV